jgi:hypothetical protein
MAETDAKRGAPTVRDLCARYVEEHLPKKRPNAAFDDRNMIEQVILPALKHRRVSEVVFSDVDALHRAITKRAPYRANRVVALLSKMFSLSIKWGWRSDNPCKGVERNPEERRQLFLTPDDIERGRIYIPINEGREWLKRRIRRPNPTKKERRGEVGTPASLWQECAQTSLWTATGGIRMASAAGLTYYNKILKLVAALERAVGKEANDAPPKQDRAGDEPARP